MTFANRNQGGSGVYARSLLAALREREDVLPWIVEGPRRSNVPRTLGWLLRGAHQSLKAKRPDVLHCPSYVAPWSVDVPLVVTVHDAAAARYPRDHPLEWRFYERVLMPRRLRSAIRVIAGSEFGRREVHDVYGVDLEKIIAIPYGLDASFLAYDAEPEKHARATMLFPGAPIGRKNLDVVLKAMAEAVPGSNLAIARLQISGASQPDFPVYARQIRNLGLESRVQWLGTVPFGDLPALYASATVVVYPSLYEGFGFPPLEAMAVGTPVIASNRGSLPEVLGDSALVVDPTDTRALIEALEAVLSKADLRCELAEKGQARARLYTWDKCAARTVDVYRAAK